MSPSKGLQKCLQRRCRNYKFLFITSITIVFVLYTLRIHEHLLEEDFHKNFHYPYDGDVYKLVQQLMNNITPDVPPINNYNFTFLRNCKDKCKTEDTIRLVYLIKSAPEYFKRRVAIRNSWGFEHRFSDVEIRRIFILGVKDGDQKIQDQIDNESRKHQDILQADFQDTYYNNTIKTMMGIKWAMRYCPSAKFYMIVDDDYYVSTKNVLRFIRNPTNYPEYLQKPFDSIKNVLLRSPKQMVDFELPDDVKLYAGYVYNSSPLRHYTSKWYISLKEYPYNKWPPYVTGGSVILSRETLKYMYYASYYTKHFKFDDIYLAIMALKVYIEPFHCDELHVKKKPYDGYNNYAYTISSHGYDDPEELVEVWTKQKSLGNA